MSDIFISYARPDRERARLLAQALEQRGWSVWWDHDIPPGRKFDDVIEEALAAARCVVVLWSRASTASDWVRNEAGEAMQRQVLIPALIDADVKIPLGFRRLQAADLSGWQGPPTPEFEQFCEAVERNVGPPGRPPPMPRPTPAPAPTPVPPPPPRPAPMPPAPPGPPVTKKSPWFWASLALGIVFLAGLASMLGESQAPGSAPGVAAPVGNVPPQAANPAGSAFTTPVAFYDNALMYQGTLSWDGRSPGATLSVDVADGQTKRSLGHRQLVAYGRPDAPGRNVFSTQIAVPGDSKTAGAHVHDVNLVFEQQPGGNWMLVRNCMAPNDCYELAR